MAAIHKYAVYFRIMFFAIILGENQVRGQVRSRVLGAPLAFAGVQFARHCLTYDGPHRIRRAREGLTT